MIRFRLTDASALAMVRRTDLHELTVTFSVPKDVDLAGRAARPAQKQAVVDELNKLQFLNAVERNGAVVLPLAE